MKQSKMSDFVCKTLEHLKTVSSHGPDQRRTRVRWAQGRSRLSSGFAIPSVITTTLETLNKASGRAVDRSAVSGFYLAMRTHVGTSPMRNPAKFYFVSSRLSRMRNKTTFRDQRRSRDWHRRANCNISFTRK